MLRRKVFIAALVGLVLLVASAISNASFTAAAQSVSWPAIQTTLVASGFQRPIYITHANDNSGRIFVAEQAGRIRIVQPGQPALTFLDITDRVRSPFNGGGSDQGLFSLAFPPGYNAKGYFYVDYTNSNGDTQISRFYRSANDPNAADPNSEQSILTITRPANDTNYGGDLIAFGPDGYLYIGAGAGENAPQNGQDTGLLKGKLLRIDVEPPSNPPTATPTATATATVSPTPTATRTPTNTPTVTPTATGTATATSTATSSPTATSNPTATASPTGTPTGTPIGTATATRAPTATPAQSETPVASPTATVVVPPRTGNTIFLPMIPKMPPTAPVGLAPARPLPALRLPFRPAAFLTAASVSNVITTTYTIPPGNPFAGNPAYRGEIWAVGLRNPWRFSFDRQNGNLYLADAGQFTEEEVNFQPGGSAGGQNYGWAVMEGDTCYNAATCNTAGLTLPVYVRPTYQNGSCVIIGGYVYRGPAFPSMQGIYYMGDYCNGHIWGLQQSNGNWVSQDLLDTSFNINSFGEDQAGELYVADANGGIYRIIVP